MAEIYGRSGGGHTGSCGGMVLVEEFKFVTGKKTKFLGRISRFLRLYTYLVLLEVTVYSPTNYTPILLCPRNLELWDSGNKN